MKNYTQSGGIDLSALSTNIAYAVLAGNGISVSSANTSSGGIATVAYTVTLSADFNDLDDVNITSVQNYDIIQYDSGTGKWINIAHTLNNITDVVITGTPGNTEVLKYDTGTSKWINATLSLDNLSDTIITTPAANQVVAYNGSNFVNTNVPVDSMSNVLITNVQDEDVLVYNNSSSKWVNMPLADAVSGVLNINSTAMSNSSGAQTYLQTFDLNSAFAVANNIFEIEAHFDITHTTDLTEEVHIKLDNSITLASVSIASGDTWKVILKAKLVALSGDKAFFTDTTYATAGRALEPTTTVYSATTAFTLGADHTIKVFVDPDGGAASTITCNFFSVTYNK